MGNGSNGKFCVTSRDAFECTIGTGSVIHLYQQEALYNDVDSEASTIIYNNDE